MTRTPSALRLASSKKAGGAFAGTRSSLKRLVSRCSTHRIGWTSTTGVAGKVHHQSELASRRGAPIETEWRDARFGVGFGAGEMGK